MRSLAALMVLLVSASAVAAELNVPVIVQELLPDGVPSRARLAEPISVGVPFSADDAPNDIDALGMTGTSAAQFRVLERNPRTGQITWVLATFLADRGPYVVTPGSGAFGGTPLGRDLGADIEIVSGPARFTVHKSGFNGLASVERNGVTLVAPHTGGGVVVQSGAVRYESGLDTNSDVVLEENGPVRAVVRARGVLRAVDSSRSFAYTVRLCFGRGQSSCRAFVTLRNADLASVAARTFDAAWFETPLELGADREVRFGSEGGIFAGHVSAAGAAYLFQGDNQDQRDARTTELVPLMTPAVGLEVAIGGSTQHALGSAADVAQGWMRVDDGQRAVLAGMRDMAALFPSGFDLQGNRLAVELFSRHNPQTGLAFSWGAYETREIVLEFAASGADPVRFDAGVRTPQFGRCEFERYRVTGALCGEHRLVTVSEQQQFLAALGKTWAPQPIGRSTFRLRRKYSFGTTGGGNQFDQDECLLLDFLRTGAGGLFLQARLGAEWKADQAVPHSDDFDYSTRQLGVNDINVTQPATFNGKGAGSLFDDEHPHWVCMAHYYHLTGEEHVREAIQDYGEWRCYRAGNPMYGAMNGGALQHMRLWSRCFRDVALLWELTGDRKYFDAVRRMATWLTTTLEVNGSIGRNLDHGYFYFNDPADPLRTVHLFFLTEMNGIGTQEAMRVLPEDDPLREELRDYMTGLAWFTLQEAQITPTAIGYPYDYYAAVPTQPGVRGDQTGLVLTHGYETTGDPEFIRRARDFTWRVSEYQHPLRASELSTHVRIYRWLHRDQAGALLLRPDARLNANGTWTLHWRAPAGARAYAVKYGAKPLVESLGFDAVTRTFSIDPATSMNFWAATNLSGEPAPGPAAGLETWTTPVLPPGTWNFAVRVFGDRPLQAATGPGLRLDAPPHPPTALPGAPAPASGPRRNPAAPGGMPNALSVVADRAGVHFANAEPGAAVTLYSVEGRIVCRQTVDGAGEYHWDERSTSGRRVAPGVYWYRVEAGDAPRRQGRIVLVR